MWQSCIQYVVALQKINKQNTGIREFSHTGLKFYLNLILRSNNKQMHGSNNYAFIDSQNLNLAIRELGWKLDFIRFRKYLFDKYKVSKAFLFIGYIEGNNRLYTHLQDAGFICIFKPTLKYKDGTTKGNCDAELVLWAMIEYTNYEKALIVTGDGDFYCLINHFIEKKKLEVVLVPNQLKFSALLKFKLFRPYLRYMNNLQDKVGLKLKKEKAP